MDAALAMMGYGEQQIEDALAANPAAELNQVVEWLEQQPKQGESSVLPPGPSSFPFAETGLSGVQSTSAFLQEFIGEKSVPGVNLGVLMDEYGAESGPDVVVEDGSESDGIDLGDVIDLADVGDVEYEGIKLPKRRSIHDRREELKRMFGYDCEQDSCLYFEKSTLQGMALEGQIGSTSHRAMAWAVYLGALDEGHSNQWRTQIGAWRADYEAMLQRHTANPHEVEGLDVNVHNPLAAHEDSPWYQYFRNSELRKEIELDVRRVYPEHSFFKDRAIRAAMLRILFVYALEHPDVRYKQGMHELLAPILYILEGEAIRVDDEGYDSADVSTMLYTVHDGRYKEHDAYVLFASLMGKVKQWYVSQASPSQASLASHRIDVQEPFDERADVSDVVQTNKVVEKCQYVHQVLLAEVDPSLYRYLTELDIEPQFYALRWIRLLFAREFHLEDVLLLWDALFAHDKHMALVDYVMVSMLTYIRESLIGHESAMCLQRLFHYPPVEDPTVFIRRAMEILANPAPSEILRSRVREEGEEVEGEKGDLGTPINNTIQRIANSSLFRGGRRMARPKQVSLADYETLREGALQIQEELAHERKMRGLLAERLGEVNAVLQREIFEGPFAREGYLTDDMIIAVAQMKHLQAVVGGFVEFTEASLAL